MQQLYRSRDNRMIAGVASGMAQYFNLDISVVRLIWILAVLLGGSGVIAYLIAWVVIPEEPGAAAQPAATPGTAAPEASGTGGESAEIPIVPSSSDAPQARNNGQLGGLILIGLGVFFLIKEFIPVDIFHYLWPLILVALGIYLLVGKR